ncbi:hypothetical protein [Pelagerythrobacter aerophilus]
MAQVLSWSPGSSSILEVEQIPPAYRGVWAPNKEACADPVWQIRMMPHGYDTYDVGGRLKRITQEGSERTVLALFEMEGEATIWDAFFKMRISEDGNSLTVEDLSDPGEIDYVRC